MNKNYLKLLLIEDDEDDFRLTRELLGAIPTFDFEIRRAPDFAAGRQAIIEENFDVCLIDERLGDYAGLDLIGAAAAANVRAPMIFLTAEANRKLSAKVMSAGAADYLVKGKFDADALERAIRYALERRRAEEELAAATRRERATIDNALDVICTVNAEGRFVTVNPACYRMWGYRPDEMLGHHTIEFMVSEDIAAAQEGGRRIRSGEPVENFESRFVHKNGSIVELLWTAHWSADEQLMYAVAHDITTRKRAEEALALENSLMQALMNNLPDAIYFKDTESRFVRVSRHVHLRGIASSEDAIGKTDFDFFAEDHARPAYEDEQRIIRTGEPLIQKEEKEVFPDGSTCWVLSTKVPIFDADGKVTGIAGMSRDITAQKRAEEALRESEYKLRTILESMREGLIQVDNQDRIVFVNECFCQMVGYAEEELMQTDWKRFLFDKDGRKIIEQVNRRRRDGIADNYELCLRTKAGERLWVIVGGAPILDAAGSVSGSLGVFTDITARKRAEEQMLHDALHDGLTGLANRTFFIEHLQKIIERNRREPQEMFAVLFLDFDRFKVINDSLGHAEGDRLLVQIAKRLTSVLRASDLVARLGGDEFTILINRIDDSSVALRVAERVRDNLRAPFQLGGGDVFISASIGIALSTTGHEKAEEMLRDADIAMYRAKAEGRAQIQVFDRQMHEHALNQLRLETEMRQALERGEFRLHYQPIFNLKSDALVAFEALVRWQHPTRGLLAPLEFIGAAEENNLILPLGKWILREGCRQLRAWQTANAATKRLKMTVNISSKQFVQADLAEQITAALAEAQISPSRLKLEITESHLMKNAEAAIQTINRLRALGIEFSLDDFGTGYSSLSRLHRLPVHFLKIDRSFVSRMIESEENAEIVRTILKLGRNLKKKIVAEGIETAEQLAQLKSLNCDFGQGYFFAKPLEPAAAAAFIADHLKTSPEDDEENL